MILPSFINSKRNRHFLGSIMYKYSSLFNQPLFSDLLIQRQKEMWKDEESFPHTSQECKNTLVFENDIDSKWYCCKNWHRKLSNKLNAKRFVSKHGIRVAKLLWSGDDPNDIPFDKLPQNYVVKTATGWSSNQVLPIKNKINAFTNLPISHSEIINYFKEIISNPLYKSTILVEDFISDSHGRNVPLDYKVYCFHGKAHFIMAIDQKKIKTVYSRNWKIVWDQINLNCNYGYFVPKPIHFNELIVTAETLSKLYKYPFVRVDLYDSNEGVVFGEYTHTPNAGISVKLYTPFANRLFGKLWTS
jgi:hypothetical protein